MTSPPVRQDTSEGVASESYRIVVVGASLGGLDALTRILSELPASFPIPLVVVQHRADTHPELLGALLRRRTMLEVKDAAAGDELRRGVVYLAPPGVHLVVEEPARLALMDGQKVKHARPSADVLFASAAEVFGRGVIALVLTGGDGDGADGVVVVKHHGGTVIAQDVASSRAPDMPRAAVETGDVDYVVPLAGIAASLESLATRGAGSRAWLPAFSRNPRA